MTDSDNQTNNTREWTVLDSELVHEGFYKVEKMGFTHALFEGGVSERVEREQFVRGNVVGVLVHDPKLDKMAMVEQFRIGARNRPGHPWLIEIVAGMIEPNETPEEVAKRETFEEAGVTVTSLTQFKHYLASPGSSSEEVFLFYAEADLSDAKGVFGLEEETEDILLHVVDTKEVLQMLESGVICNALSIIALQWFALNRLQNKV